MNSNKLITRRNAIITGLASVGGLLLPGCSRKLPPTYGHILRMGDNLTYAAHRALLPGQSLAKEYSHKDISSFPATGTTNPGDPKNPYGIAAKNPKSRETYRRLQGGGFADWRLSVEGLVARPGSYSLADLKRFPSRTQITKHVCEESSRRSPLDCIAAP